jgi:uncharacterized protein
VQIEGSRRIRASRDRVWSLLNDPAVLARCTPGVTSLEPDGENAYKAMFGLAIGPVKGQFRGQIQVQPEVPGERMTLTVQARGPVGAVSAIGQIALEADADGTVVAYSGEPQLHGMLAAVGGRLVQTVAKSQIDSFFARFEQEVLEQEVHPS